MPAHTITHNGGAAVCFLWRFPSIGLDANFPDVIRHTALWSSDFPPAGVPKDSGERPSGPAAYLVIISSGATKSASTRPAATALSRARLLSSFVNLAAVESFMNEMPNLPVGSRRNEDIALDLMKFIAMTTAYGKTASGGVGFQGSGAAAKPEEYAGHLLELYGRCLNAVANK